jgi:Spy/CpxP family protein refolding chaperone
MTFKTLAVALLLGASVTLVQTPAHAQSDAPPAAAAMPTPDKPLTAADLEGLRAELRSSKKQITAATLTLTDAEATRFWPVYDQYAHELTAIKDGQYALIAEYVNRFGQYDDKAAIDFITRWLAQDVKTATLRAKYVPLVGKALPGVKAATFFQIDRRIAMAIDLKIASSLPILQTQTTK